MYVRLLMVYVLMRGSQMSIEVVLNFEHLAMHQAYIAHYTMLFHNQGGYYNSLILQVFELSP